MEEQLKELLFKYALLNAVQHKGHAQSGAVIGVIMASHPEYRGEASKVAEFAKEIVGKINSMTLNEQNSEIQRRGIQTSIKKKKTENKKLIDLPNVSGEVVLRFAPNPSGPLHIGHARAAILNQKYVERYGGKLILRIEDTDPRRVDSEAYQMIEDDLKWLGVKWHEKVVQSDRIELYHKYAVELIKLGQAYICTCPGNEFKKLKDNKKPCPCRELSINDNLKRWSEMPSMSEGEAVLRVKTDLQHKNPAIRDWVGMRIVESIHPRVDNKFKIYPMMNFAVAVDDHLLGITHVLRGKDHLANSEKQEYLYHHFGWSVPEFIHYGRLKMEDVALSTSRAREGIKEGIYTGWDDPRLGTLKAVAKRGIKKEALEELMLEIGVKMADTIISWKKIYGLNRNLLEKEANRYFAVLHPQEVKIEDLPPSSKGPIKRLKHPDYPDRGYRTLNFDGNIYLDTNDLQRNEGKVLRLMDAVNIIFKEGKAVFHSSSLDEARKLEASIIQWLPTNSVQYVKLVMPDNTVLTIAAESSVKELKLDDIIQFERVGFARLDIKEPVQKFYFAHK